MRQASAFCDRAFFRFKILGIREQTRVSRMSHTPSCSLPVVSLRGVCWPARSVLIVLAFIRLVLHDSALLTPHANGADPPALPRADADGKLLPDGSIARLGTSRWREGTRLWGVQLSPDGKVVAYTTQGGDVKILDRASGREIRRLVPRGDQVAGYPVFSPDAHLLAAIGSGKTIQIWEVATGKLVHAVYGTESFSSVAFSGDGRMIAAGGGFPDKNVRTWNLGTGKETGRFEVISNRGAGVALSSDGTELATWACDPVESLTNRSVGAVAQIWDVAAKKEIHRLTAEDAVLGLGVAPSGKEVAIDTKRSVQIFELATGSSRRLSRKAGEPGFPASKPSYAPDGKSLAVFTPIPLAGHGFTLWDAVTGTRQSPPVPPCPPNSVVFAGNRILACGVHGHTVRVWDVDSGKDLVPVKGHCGAITSLVWTSKDRTIVSADSKGRVCLWDVATGRMTFETQGSYSQDNSYPSGAGLCAVAPDSKHIVTADGRRQPYIQILDDARSHQYPIRVPERLTDAMTAFAAAKPAAAVAGESPRLPGGDEYAIYLFDVRTGAVTRELAVPSIAMGVALSEDAKRVAAAYAVDTDSDGQRYAIAVRVWDAETGKVLPEFMTISFARDWNLGRVPLTFARNRRFLTVGENGGLVGLWNPETGKRLGTFGGEAGWQVGALLAFPDQATVAIGMHQLKTGRAKIQLRELASGQVRAEFSGHSGPVSSLALSADGKVLASGSCDTTVILWDLTGLAQRGSDRLSAQDAEALWRQLGGQDALRAYRAIWRLAGSPHEAFAMLASKLKPETDSPSTVDIARLIRQLDDAGFAARERALQGLRRVGEPARQALKKAIAGEPSEETRGRIESLLADLDSGRPLAEELRALRAVEVLEHAATPEARALLEKLAAGNKDRALTQAADIARNVLASQEDRLRR